MVLYVVADNMHMLGLTHVWSWGAAARRCIRALLAPEGIAAARQRSAEHGSGG
jgi:hypothetical protein